MYYVHILISRSQRVIVVYLQIHISLLRVVFQGVKEDYYNLSLISYIIVKILILRSQKETIVIVYLLDHISLLRVWFEVGENYYNLSLMYISLLRVPFQWVRELFYQKAGYKKSTSLVFLFIILRDTIGKPMIDPSYNRRWGV